MPTIDFDWGKFNDSQWTGLPKNNHWKKYPQWESEVVSSNPDKWDPELADLKQAHRFMGYKVDQWYDAAGCTGTGDTWADHIKDVLDNA